MNHGLGNLRFRLGSYSVTYRFQGCLVIVVLEVQQWLQILISALLVYIRSVQFMFSEIWVFKIVKVKMQFNLISQPIWRDSVGQFRICRCNLVLGSIIQVYFSLGYHHLSTRINQSSAQSTQDHNQKVKLCILMVFASFQTSAQGLFLIQIYFQS